MTGRWKIVGALWLLGGVGAVQVSYQSTFLSHIRLEPDGGHRHHSLAASETSEFLRNALGLGKDIEFRNEGERVDRMGYTHQRWVEYYRGVRVEDSLYHVHLKEGKVVSANGEAYQVDGLSTTPTVAMESAWETAKGHVGTAQCNPQRKEGEVVVLAVGDDMALAFKFTILADLPCVAQAVFVDAIGGGVLKSYHLERTSVSSRGVWVETWFSGYQVVATTATGTGYDLWDTERNINTYLYDSGKTHIITSKDNKWAKDKALDLHWGLQKAYDYFFEEFGLLSYDNKRGRIQGYYKYPVKGGAAFQPPNFFLFNEDTTVETVAHEYTHAVTANTAGLHYNKESGALNEGFSDIFGEVIEHWVGKPAENKWKVGSELNYIRNMKFPKQFGNPNTYGGEHWRPTVGCSPNQFQNDYCWVHYNSGVLGHWFYRLAEGGSGVNDLGAPFNVKGVGMEPAARVAFDTLQRLTPNSDYWYAMTESLEAALPHGADVFTSVQDAWKAVGLDSGCVEGGLRSVTVAIQTDHVKHDLGKLEAGVLKDVSNDDYQGSKSRTVVVGYKRLQPEFSFWISDGSSWCVSVWIDFNNNNRIELNEVQTTHLHDERFRFWKDVPDDAAGIGEVLMRVAFQEGSCQSHQIAFQCNTFGVQLRFAIVPPIPVPALQCLDQDPVTKAWRSPGTFVSRAFFFQLQVRATGAGTIYSLGNLEGDQVELAIKDVQTPNAVLRNVVVLTTCIAKQCEPLHTTKPIPLDRWVGISGTLVPSGSSDLAEVHIMVGDDLWKFFSLTIPRLVWRTHASHREDLSGQSSSLMDVTDLSVCFYRHSVLRRYSIWTVPKVDLLLWPPSRHEYATTFGGGFSFSAFVLVTEYTNWGRIFDFGGGPRTDNVLVTQYASTGTLQLHTYRGSQARTLASSTPLPRYEWVAVLVVVRPMQDQAELAEAWLTVGRETWTGVVYTPRVVSRARNFMGSSNWDADQPLKGIIEHFYLEFEHPGPGHLTLPHTADEGIFGGGFTFNAFVWLNRYTRWARVFDYGNGPVQDNVLLCQRSTTGQLYLEVRRSGRPSRSITFPTLFPLKKWVHIKITVQRREEPGELFDVEWSMDGVHTRGEVYPAAVTFRERNYIGRSNWEQDEPWDGMIHTFHLTFDIEAPCFAGNSLYFPTKMWFPQQQQKQLCASSAFGRAFEFSARLRFDSLGKHTIFMLQGHHGPDDRIYLERNRGSLYLCTRGATECSESLYGSSEGQDIYVDIKLIEDSNANNDPDVPGRLFVGGQDMGKLLLPRVLKRRIYIGDPDFHGTIEDFRLYFE